MRSAFRAALMLSAAVVLVAGLAGPALAHGRGSDATNYSSRVLSAPPLPGVSWRVYGGDEFLGVTSTQTEILIIGYEREPYLRVGPDGVFENRNSPATYLNQERLRTDLPAGVQADPSAEPDWHRVSDGGTALWHDHRVHWMAASSAVVDPGQPQDLFEWSVPFLANGDEYAVLGELVWVPAPPVWPWVLAAFGLSALALVGLRSRPAGDRWPVLARPAVAVLGLVILLNLTHLVDDLFAVPLSAGVKTYAAAQTAIFLAVGVFGVIRGWHAGDAAFTALGVGAGAVFIGQGLLYLPALGASQLTTLFPESLARLTIALSLVQIVPMGIIAFQGTKVLVPEEPAT